MARRAKKATNRDRRIIVNVDTGWGLPGVEDNDAAELVDAIITFLAGQEGSQVDSIFWCWGEMNYAPLPSAILPVNAGYQRWLRSGIDPVRISLEETRKRGLEAFYTFRINSGNDFGDWSAPPVLVEHPSWGIPSPIFPSPHRHFNFAIKEARDYKLSLIREVVEGYDFDGFEIDWRCGLINLPLMRAWEHRDSLTELMRAVRVMTREIGERKGRSILLAARVPENVEGCHCDGIDVETWVKQDLVDILALGCHNFEVDVQEYRRLTSGTGIKLYASIDEHHPSSGYEHPPIEVFRGVASNFWRQGIDGIYAFNFYPVPVIQPFPRQWDVHRQALCEMGSPGTLDLKDKVFVTQRRGGGGWPETCEYFYANTNCFAQLPRRLSSGEHEEVYLWITVGDDLNAMGNRVVSATLRVLLSNATVDADIGNALRVRINGVLLGAPFVQDGWLSYTLKPAQTALGRNTVALKLKSGNRLAADGPTLAADGPTVEKLEIAVGYRVQ